MFDAYLQMCLGVMALRIPAVQDILGNRYPEASITSSYSDENLNMAMNVRNMLGSIAKKDLVGSPALRSAFTQINSILLISMWELLKETKTYLSIATNEDIQFLRHVRNGCAHDNQFNFDSLEHPAKWRDKEITRALLGKSMFPNFLKDADPILLLLDINNKYFEPLLVQGFEGYQ